MEAKCDFLYIFNYNPPFFNDALERFMYSIESIKSQSVRICVSNNSQFCIKDILKKHITNFKYIHKPTKEQFSRAKAINFAVKNLVETEYFIMSDIDLVYSPDHIQRVFIKISNLSNTTEKVRFISYNYNLLPICRKTRLASLCSRIPLLRRCVKDENFYTPHVYSSDFTVLDQLARTNGGFAHGNGLIHLETFISIRGYDEEMIGYGPEDSLFNTRISKVNRIIYDNLPDTASFHLWHPRFHMIQFEKNLKIWKEKTHYYNLLQNPKLIDVSANLDQSEWGVL